jgi:hypothetical protein
MQPSDQSTRSSGPTQRMTRASQKSEPTSSLQLDQPASPSKLQAGGRARVAFLFGWGLTGSLPARQHHPASSADQNRTSGRDACIKQLCQSCNQSTPSVSLSLGLFVWLVADGWCWFVLRESTAGWLLVAGLLWEKNTADWWRISQANRLTVDASAKRPYNPCSNDECHQILEEQTINALCMLHPAWNCYTTEWVVMSTFHTY